LIDTYRELREAWKRELENSDLGKLPADFYSGIANYVKKLKEESRMLDKRTAKAILLRKETQNVKRMARELIQVRYRKIVDKGARGQEIAHDVLTAEEEEIFKKISPIAEMVSCVLDGILRGRAPKATIEHGHKKIVLRFLKDIPAIVGVDMKTYGPFKAEDIASIPSENAKILTEQGLAEKVEVT
jgi:DNA replication factor GINS